MGLKTPLSLIPGLKICASDGSSERGFPEMASSELFYFAKKEDRLVLLDDTYKFNVATYSTEIDPNYIYTYCYANEQSWVKYRNDLNGESYRFADYTFEDNVYFRYCLRKADGGEFNGAEDINKILRFDAAPRKLAVKPWILDEAARVTDKINRSKCKGDLVFALITDSHYVVNGTWDDTFSGVSAVCSAVGFDGIIHLGDISDGMVSRSATRHYADIVLDDLKNLGAPVWVAIGNHDTNYFNKNTEPFSIEEQSQFYLGRENPHYAIDFERQRLRLIFLDSFDAEEALRYGYNDKCLDWLEKTLNDLSGGWKSIIFSHLPPFTRLQFWTKEIRGEKHLTAIINTHKDKVLAFINGHNHADKLDNGLIPVISINNSKCEAFTEYKTEGFITPERALDAPTQECWDILLVKRSGAMRFFRFGSGNDRKIENNIVEWV